LRYNDLSVLENFHCSLLFKCLQNETENVLGHLSPEIYRECRRIIVFTILATDLGKHFKAVKDLRVLIEMNTVAFYIGQEEFRKSTPQNYRIPDDVIDVLNTECNRDMCLELVLHCADVGANLLKPFDVCKRWALLIMEEFFAQGDKEKELGLPVQMSFDRDRVNFYASQIGFVEVIVAPLLTLLTYVFPPTTDALSIAERNLQRWFDLWCNDGEKTQEEINYMAERVTKVTDDFADARQFQRASDQGDQLGRNLDSVQGDPELQDTLCFNAK